MKTPSLMASTFLTRSIESRRPSLPREAVLTPASMWISEIPTGIFYAQGVKANVLFFDKRVGREQRWTDKLWIYDLRTNIHFTLKTNPLSYDDLTDFISCFNADNRHERKETERFKVFTCDELMQRDKVSLDIFWLRDDSLEDSANLPAPELLAQEISENLQAALEQFNSIYESLSKA